MLQHSAMLLRRGEYRHETDDSIFSDLRKELTNMLTSILGARLSWYQANGWVFDPVIVGPDIIEYTLAKGQHAGRHAIQHFYYQRVAPGVETTVWYEESGAIVHIRWYLETQTTHRFAALPAWLAKDMTVYRGDNQDPDRLHSGRQIDRSARQRCVACRLEPKAMRTLADGASRFDSPFADV